MAYKDIRSQLLPRLAFKATIASDTTTTGNIIDTADYDAGLVYTLLCTTYGAGTYTPVLNESEASDMSGSNVVDASQMIGTVAGAAISAVSPSGATGTLNSFGAFGTKRYLRLDIVSVSSSTTAISAVFQGAPEINPSPLLSA